MDDKCVCFLHSCNINSLGVTILEYLINFIKSKGLLDKLEYLFINNIGNNLDELKFRDISEKIFVTNYSTDSNIYENCTLRQMHFFSRLHPKYKILYLHTKGISHAQGSQVAINVKYWNDFMLYCLVDKYSECLTILNYVDVVGCNYQHIDDRKSPTHYSGNFWWANSQYIQTLAINHLQKKHDAEFWLFRNNPTFINIHSPLKYDCYTFSYTPDQYTKLVDAKLPQIIENLKSSNTVKIFYGANDNYIDVTDICHQHLKINNVIKIPAGDLVRNKFFTDPLPGIIKDVKIGNIKYPYIYDVALPCSI